MDTTPQEMTQGNRQGVAALLGSAGAIFFIGSLVFGFPGLMGPVWREMLDIQTGALDYVMFFLLASLGVFMFYVGKWTNIYGVRRLMQIGTIIAGLVTVMVAYVANVAMIYLWAFSIGAASCFIYSPGVNTVQRWYPQKRGLVSGSVNLTFGISAAIMVPIYRVLLETIGYQLLCLAVAAMTVAVGLLASQYTEMPERVKGINTQTANPIETPPLPTDLSFTPREAVRTSNFWLIWSVWALMGGAGVSMVTLSVRYGMSMGYTLATAATVLSAFNVANGLSRIVTGFVSDIIGRNLTLSITFIGAGVAYLLLPYTSHYTLILVLATAIGFGYGTLFACSAPLISDCFGLKHFGIILGLVFTSYGFLAGIIGPGLSGWLLGLTEGNYTFIFNYLGLLCLISALLILFVSPPKKA